MNLYTLEAYDEVSRKLMYAIAHKCFWLFVFNPVWVRQAGCFVASWEDYGERHGLKEWPQ